MRSRFRRLAGGAVIAAVLGLTLAAAADLEVTAPDGRRILLKDDGTWRYVEGNDKGAAKEKSAEKPPEKPKVVGEAVLRLERRDEAGGGCRFALQLTNNFPHVIQSFVPTFSATRANGVAYDSQNAGFISLRPGDSQTQEIQFRGIGCPDIARLQVSGGDRCVMGELDRFSPADGQCLARVRVVESNLVRFDKQAEEPIVPRDGAEKSKDGSGTATAPGQSK